MFPVYISNFIIKTIFGTFSGKYWDSLILSLFILPDTASLFTEFANLYWFLIRVTSLNNERRKLYPMRLVGLLY
jgi:hypothetical protein